MSTSLKTMSESWMHARNSAIQTSTVTHELSQVDARSVTVTMHPAHSDYMLDLLADNIEWLDQEYREAYLEGFLEQNIAAQIQINRKRRNLSQSQLAERIGTTQSAIARSENPAYGKYSIIYLSKLAHAFNCALSVKFIPYSELAYQRKTLSEQTMFAEPFDEQIHKIRESNESKKDERTRTRK